MTAQEKKALLLVFFLLGLGSLGFSVEQNSTRPLSPPSSEKETSTNTSHSISIKKAKKERKNQKQDAPIDINTAEKEDFQKLPGIGPKLAQRIISYRQEHGSFSSIEDLKRVKGIGAKKIVKIKSHLKRKKSVPGE